METGFILQKSGLSKTKSRMNILTLMDKTGTPLSGKEICYMLPEKCDKSTVYRTLNSLYERNILQRIIIDHELKFALRATNGKNGHLNDHLHFKCKICNKLYCIKEITIQKYRLPEGFTPEENQFLVMGKCKACQ